MEIANSDPTGSSVKSPHYVLLSIALLIGLPGMLLNALVAYIKTKYCKQYNSPTYVFMVQRALADILVLICVSIGTVVFILYPKLPIQHRFLEDILAFILNFGWHPGCNFLCIIVYSRYIGVCANDKLKTYFSNAKVKVYICSSWMFFGIVYSIQFYNPYNGRITRWWPETLSWGNDVNNSVLGMLLYVLTMSQSFFSFVIIGFYNVRTLLYLRRVRKSLEIVDGRTLCKHEVNLFLQAFITSLFYVGVKVTYVVLNILIPHSEDEALIWGYVWLNFVWIMNSSVSPLVYIMHNKMLRQHIRSMFTCQRIVECT